MRWHHGNRSDRDDLLFERFLSEERGEWPDIDLDLPSGDQREAVIQYVYRRYGQRGAAMAANVITYRFKFAARETGKVLGFDPDSISRLFAAAASWEWRGPEATLDEYFRTAELDLGHSRIRCFLGLCRRVLDLPRHLGQPCVPYTECTDAFSKRDSTNMECHS
jgi:error-prone DNA polymerase